MLILHRMKPEPHIEHVEPLLEELAVRRFGPNAICACERRKHAIDTRNRSMNAERFLALLRMIRVKRVS